MTKSKSNLASHMPKAPWIYINDFSDAHEHAAKLASMIPKTVHLQLTQCPSTSPDLLRDISQPRWNDTVVVLSRSNDDCDDYDTLQAIKALKEASIKNGNNFASIRIRAADEEFSSGLASSHHADIKAASRAGATTLGNVKTTAYTMYKWLFSVFTVLEHLHLIADRQMTAIDASATFKDYVYCPIGDSRNQSKNAKIQFVALVMGKPEIGPDQRLHWQVADKSGVANFYFHYRGPSSQYTWDWVLALNPGDRKCLPRMPLVEVKERAITTILKSPFRASAAITDHTGKTLQLAGQGLCYVGAKLKLGDRRKWLPENDPAVTGKTHRKLSSDRLWSLKDGNSSAWKNKSYGSLVPAEEKTEVWIFSEKGEKVWRDDDSEASTEAESILSKD